MTTPLDWHRSNAFDAEKHNGKQGIGSKRIMHAYCSMGMAWFRGIHRRGTQPDHPAWAHGGLAHRSRENALTCISSLQWRADQSGDSAVHSNYDCTNAFASTKRALLEVYASKYAREEDQAHAVRAIQYPTFSMHCPEGWQHFQSIQGAQMVFTLSPRQFNDCYNPYVEKWNENIRGVYQITATM